MKAAILFLPGMNCEVETARAVSRSGLETKIIRWNEEKTLFAFDAFVLPGGFSFEDRGRAGVIASYEPLIAELKKESQKGKPILGICNGAQIIVESNILDFPLALAPNFQVQEGNFIRFDSFYNEWIFIKNSSHKKTPFNSFPQRQVLKIPTAHGEGRFFSRNKIPSDRVLFKYCDQEGHEGSEFPVNPNGSEENAAAMTNEAGNVCAMMPHPERAEDGDLIFRSMSEFLNKKHFSLNIPSKKESSISRRDVEIKRGESKWDLEFFISLKITDNEKWTMENTLKKTSFKNLKLKKYRWIGIKSSPKDSSDDLENRQRFAREIILKGNISNSHRENLIFKALDRFFKFSRQEDYLEIDNFPDGFFVTDNQNHKGEIIKKKLHSDGFMDITELEFCTFWQLLDFMPEEKEDLIKSRIFFNSEVSSVRV